MEPEILLAIASAFAAASGTAGISSLLESVLKRIRGEVEEDNESKIAEEFKLQVEKIENARENIASALGALDTMAKSIVSRQQELGEIQNEVNEALKQKGELEKSVEELRNIKKRDVQVAQEVFGVPTEKERRQSRFRGFIEGVVASIVATVIYVNTPVIFTMASEWYSSESNGSVGAMDQTDDMGSDASKSENTGQ